jgi:hypothetical protein
VALARRLAGILFALWRDGTTFDPMRVGRRPHVPAASIRAVSTSPLPFRNDAAHDRAACCPAEARGGAWRAVGSPTGR